MLEVTLFQGKLVRLRPIKETDIPTLAAWYADPEVMTHQTTGPLIAISQAGYEDLIRGWTKDSPSQTAFALERLGSQGSDDTLLGMVNLRFGPTTHYATLVIMIGKPFWGQGFGREALQLLLDYAFNERNLHRVQLTVNADNTRAVRAYERAGFVIEGRARDAYFRAGAWCDMFYMSMLQHEFSP